MADGNIPALQGDPQGISDEALRKAEEFVEAEEGATNRLTGIAGTVVTGIAVAMSLFHLYAAIARLAVRCADLPTQPLRYTHVAFVLVLSFLLFPVALRFRNRIRWWDVVLRRRRRRDPRLRALGRRRLHRPRHHADQLDVVLGVIFIVLLLEATRRTTGLDHAGRRAAVHRLRHARAVSAAAVDAPRLRHQPAGRPSVHHAGGHLRHRRSTCRRR